MTGNQDAGILSDSRFHFRDLRPAECCGVCLVQERHRGDCGIAAFQNQRGKFFRRKFSGQGGKRTDKKRINGFILEVKHGGMIGVGADSFQAIGQKLFQGPDVLVFLREHADWRQRDGRIDFRGPLLRLPDEFLNPRSVEVGIGDRGKHRLHHKGSCSGVRFHPLVFQSNSQPLQFSNQTVHRIGCFRLLAAHSPDRASLVRTGFLALKTEHFRVHNRFLPSLFVFMPPRSP